MTYQTVNYTPPANAQFAMGILRATPLALAALRLAGTSVPDVLRQHGTGTFGHPPGDEGDATVNPPAPPADERLCTVLQLEMPNHGLLLICVLTNIARTETLLMLLEEFH